LDIFSRAVLANSTSVPGLLLSLRVGVLSLYYISLHNQAQTPEIPEFLGTAHGNQEWAANNIPPPNSGLLGSVPAHLAPDAKLVEKAEKKACRFNMLATKMFLLWCLELLRLAMLCTLLRVP
jgi:hypothetical protein